MIYLTWLHKLLTFTRLPIMSSAGAHFK